LLPGIATVTTVSVFRGPAYVPVVGATAVSRKTIDWMAVEMYCGERAVEAGAVPGGI
jgi:hypothetical protein